jgi:hypothetical protein
MKIESLAFLIVLAIELLTLYILEEPIASSALNNYKGKKIRTFGKFI